MNDVRMNLPQRDQRPRRAFRRGARRHIRWLGMANPAAPRSVFLKADVQRSSAIAGGEAAGTHGESVHQPRNMSEVCRCKNLRLGRCARLCRGTFAESWHTFILIARVLVAAVLIVDGRASTFGSETRRWLIAREQ
jgi:hypothetical protein